MHALSWSWFSDQSFESGTKTSHCSSSSSRLIKPTTSSSTCWSQVFLSKFKFKLTVLTNSHQFLIESTSVHATLMKAQSIMSLEQWRNSSSMSIDVMPWWSTCHINTILNGKQSQKSICNPKKSSQNKEKHAYVIWARVETDLWGESELLRILRNKLCALGYILKLKGTLLLKRMHLVNQNHSLLGASGVTKVTVLKFHDTFCKSGKDISAQWKRNTPIFECT